MENKYIMAINIDTHLALLQNLQSLDDDASAVMFNTGGELLAKIKNRIVQDGLNSLGSKIGIYSTTPMYATIDQFDKKSAFKPIAKQGGEVAVYDIKTKKRKVENVTNSFRKPTTMFLPQGYRQLREIQGKEVAFVNLSYTTSMMVNFQLLNQNGIIVIGFRTEEEAKKRHSLEKKYSQIIFSGSKEELTDFSNDFIKEFTEILLKYYHGAK